MKKMYFFNDRFKRLSWKIRIPIYLLIGILLLFPYYPSDFIPLKKEISLLIVGAYTIFVLNHLYKIKGNTNYYSYGGNQVFTIRLNGKNKDFNGIHIGKINYIDNHLLEINRINRWDRLDLSHIRDDDKKKLLEEIKFNLNKDVNINYQNSAVTHS